MEGKISCVQRGSRSDFRILLDLICAGENFYASMRRSTNGGGENSPKLLGEDDFYELFFAGLENDK